MTRALPAGARSHALEVLFPEPGGEVDQARQTTRRLRDFVQATWPLVEPATPFISNWHIDCVCEHLEAQTAGELPRLIINQPPRTMKSLLTAVFWPAWEWLTAPHIRWLYASYAESLSIRDNAKMRRLILTEGGRTDGTLFQRLGYQGVLRLLDTSAWSLMLDQNMKKKYETTAMGMRLATSVGGTATGEGGDRIVVDDPLNPKQASSDQERVTATTWWDETMTTRFNNAAATATIVMQRLHEKDLAGHLLEKGGWHHLCLPAEYEPGTPFTYPETARLPDQADGTPGRTIGGDPRTEAGELLDPERLPAVRLAELRKALGSYGYAGQMLQRPAPRAGGMFKTGWFRRYDPRIEETLHLGWDRVVQSWDMRFSDSQKASSSFVVGQTWGFHGADSYLLAQVRGRFSFVESLAAVRAMTEYRPEAVAKLVEDKANGPAVISSLRRSIPGLIPIQPDGTKEARAAAVTPLVEAGNVWLPAGDTIPCPEVMLVRDDEGTLLERVELVPTTVTDFLQEHSGFPAAANDDQVDALSQALSWAKPQPRAPVVPDDPGEREASPAAGAMSWDW